MNKKCVALYMALAAFAAPCALAQTRDIVRVAIPQRGSWETSPSDIGQVKGIFAKHGIKTETLYTSGGGETMQALISGSVDIAIATGAAAKGITSTGTAWFIPSWEVILLSSEPFPFKKSHIGFFKNHFPHTKIAVVDGAMFSWYGTRLMKWKTYANSLERLVNFEKL